MPNSHKTKGDAFERACCAYLTENTRFTVKRRFGAGAQLDEGDLYGLPSMTIQAADWKRQNRSASRKTTCSRPSGRSCFTRHPRRHRHQAPRWRHPLCLHQRSLLQTHQPHQPLMVVLNDSALHHEADKGMVKPLQPAARLTLFNRPHPWRQNPDRVSRSKLQRLVRN